MTNVFVYLFGVLFVMGATGYGALGVSDRWIGAGIAVGIGLGILPVIVATRRLHSSL